MERQVCIIGAGPAGLAAAIFSARQGALTTLLEANAAAGRKLLMTGGGRCNLTHRIEPDELVRLFGKMGKFLSYAIYEYPPRYICDFFARIGIETKTEKDGCIFPASYKAQQVRDSLVKEAERHNVRFLYNNPVVEIVEESSGFLIKTDRQQIHSKKIVIATGGISWSETGSKGDGYRFARQLGHSIVEPRAALVPLVTEEKWPAELAGISIDKVKIAANLNTKKIITQGALVFTDNGIGGPAAQDISRHLADSLPANDKPVEINLDLAPDSRAQELEERIMRLVNENPKRKITGILSDFLPRRPSLVVCRLAGCDSETLAAQLTKDARRRIIHTVKSMPLSILRARSIEEAIVTRGGVNLSEINPKTMESKICKGLFFAGEVIDADGPCGGYNLQICWSTGALAGRSAAEK